MQKKYFKIKNTNVINTICSNIIQYFINLAWAAIIANIVLYIARTIGNMLENKIVDYVIDFIMVIIALLLWALLLKPFFPKKVFVDDYFVTIKRNLFNVDILPNIWKWKICYGEIVSCEIFNNYYSKSRWISSKNRFVYYFPSWDNIVVISTNDGKNYYIPVENPDEFIMTIKSHLADNA